MLKLVSIALIAILFCGFMIFNVNAIPVRDKQVMMDEINSYGMDISEQYPEKKPTSADDYYKIGIKYLYSGMPQASFEQFKKSLEINQNHPDSLIGIALSLSWMGSTEKSLEYINKAIKSQPNNSKVLNAAGVIRMSNATTPAHLREAEGRFKEAISLDPKSVAPHTNLALLYTSMRESIKAINEYKTVINMQPNNISAHAGLTAMYIRSGNIEAAKGEAEKIVKIAPNNPVSHNMLGEIYEQKKLFDEALAEFQQAIKLSPTYAQGYKGIGDIYAKKKLLDKAIEQYNQALSYNPKYAEAYSNLAEIYIMKGMYKEASDKYKKAIEILPASALISVPIYNNLAYIYAEKEENMDQALSYAQRAKQLVPNDPDVADTIGWIFYKKGNYKEAVDNLKMAIKFSPNNPIIRYHLGAAYYKNGNKKEAEAELREALKVSSKFDGAEEAKRLLNEIK